MIKRIRSIPLLLVFFFTANMEAQVNPGIDWKEEIGVLGRELAARHCNLFFQRDSASLFKALDQVAAQTGSLSLFDISVRLQQVIASIGDPGTRINYHFNIGGAAILPLDLYWFEDEIRIMGCRAGEREMLGNRLVAINGYPMEQIIDSLSTLIVAGNQQLIRTEVPGMITWTPLLTCFGFTGNDQWNIEYQNDEGKKGTSSIRLPAEEGEWIGLKGAELPLGWRDRNSFFHDRYFPDERIYYIQYNKCWSREAEAEYGSGASALFMPSFREFEKKVFRTIRREVIDKLVFDMRFNEGGNADQGTAFIRKLCRTRFRGSGAFYVIVGRQTSGSAIINVADFMKYSEPVIVGEETGGRPNHYGGVERFILDASGLVVNYSTRYLEPMEEDLPWITPHLGATMTFGQYIHGADPCMEAIRSHTPE